MKDPRFAKFVVFVNSAVPPAILGWDAFRHQLGANPVNFALKTTGMLALIFLVLSLVVTPLRKISGWNWLSHFRRMIGVYAFFYACVHFLIYFGLEQSFDVKSTLADVVKRRFIFFGMTALVLLVPLAITSTNGMIKRLGGKRWKQLHRLVYIAAAAGAIHYWMLVKADTRQPMAFIAVLSILLGYRVVVAVRSAMKKTPATASRVSGNISGASIK